LITTAIAKVISKTDLSGDEMAEVMTAIMTGGVSPAQMAAFLVAMRMKGETVTEITAAARVMRSMAEKPGDAPDNGCMLLDTCGTGGDARRTFNISTIACFVIAGAGVKVAKHGNRSVSSCCGSADLMQALGIMLEFPPTKICECIERVGMGFLYAPFFHRAMKYAAPVRKELGVRTIFNLLGPLTNPVMAPAQLIGVFAPELTETFARVLINLGCERALVVHGSDGLDEITITGTTRITEVHRKEMRTYSLDPRSLGMALGQPEELVSRSIEDNVAMCREVLEGRGGARRNIVLLNSAAGLIAAGKVDDFPRGIAIAAESIDSGRARDVLDRLIRFTNDW
jgi:anthranilate phosphoribosyltransferase